LSAPAAVPVGDTRLVAGTALAELETVSRNLVDHALSFCGEPDIGKKLKSSWGIPSFIRNLGKGVLFPAGSIDLTRSQTAEPAGNYRVRTGP
jgi:hypothetical protein